MEGLKLYQLYLVYEINTLEQMTTKFVKEEGIEEVSIGNVVIILLLYVDDLCFFQKLW